MKEQVKDLLGSILSAKKGQALQVTINIEPSEDSDEQQMKDQGLAPSLEDKEGEPKEMPVEGSELDEDVLMNGGEKDAMKRKMKLGQKPMGLSDRAKMYSLLED